jgi:hypothetical protein
MTMSGGLPTFESGRETYLAGKGVHMMAVWIHYCRDMLAFAMCHDTGHMLMGLFIIQRDLICKY